MKQGVIPILARETFDPREQVRMRGGKDISFTSRAERSNNQLLKASRISSGLHNRGVEETMTIQKIFSVARNED